jgi:hypothetical protein
MDAFYLHIPQRRSVAAPVGNPTLFVNNRRITIDERNLPGNLVRLLPHAYAHAPKEAWKPFLTLAEAMGLLV